MKLRRSYNQRDCTNLICVNFILDETNLRFGKERRDVYTAHEIAQLKPLFEREHTYEAFLQQNQWVRQYLPHALDRKQPMVGANWQTNYFVLQIFAEILGSKPIEAFLRIIQVLFIKRHQTTEIVTKTLLAFHPNNYRFKTLHNLRKRMTEVGLLTNL